MGPGLGQDSVLRPGLHAAALFAGAQGIAKVVEDVHPQARGEAGLQPVLADARAYLVDRPFLAAGNLQQGIPHGLLQADAGSLPPHTNVPDNQRAHNILPVGGPNQAGLGHQEMEPLPAC